MREGCELPFASDELVSHDMLLRLSVVEDSGGRSWSLESRDDGVIRQRSNECFVDSIDACGGWLSLADTADQNGGRRSWGCRIVRQRNPMMSDRSSFGLTTNNKLGGRLANDRGVGCQNCLLLDIPV